MDGHIYAVAITRHGLVDAVVDHLVDQVMQPGHINVADVHGRPFAHSLEPFEYFYIVFVISAFLVFFHILIGMITLR